MIGDMKMAFYLALLSYGRKNSIFPIEKTTLNCFLYFEFGKGVLVGREALASTRHYIRNYLMF
jgi:hypothetical protein